jgi:hypothetical protein
MYMFCTFQLYMSNLSLFHVIKILREEGVVDNWEKS